MSQPTLRILGTRGVPAAHGGFETFAERLSLYLVERGWRVVVYCQQEGVGGTTVDSWQGVERVTIAVPGSGPRSTMAFDWLCIKHAARHDDLCLTLGYNTAAFCVWLRLRGVRNVINMDGIEWSRAKWGAMAKAWLWMNERAGCWLGDVLIADHPAIEAHLVRAVSARKIRMIPYGADGVESAPAEALERWGLHPGAYLTVIARPEPENSLLEVVQAFSARSRGLELVVLGRYDPDNAYHCAVRAAASAEVRFIGAVYEPEIVRGLRYHAAGYVHGHQVGGTNPSLVEALGAGNPVLAHDNRFNRWVAGAAGRYFSDSHELDDRFSQLLSDESLRRELSLAARARHAESFTWALVLGEYADMLQECLSAPTA